MESNNVSSQPAAHASPKRYRGLKIASGIVVGVVLLLVLAVLAVPTALSSSGGRRFVLSRINRAVDGQVGMDALSVGWFRGVRLSNLSFESGDGATQLTVDRIETHPQYAALIGGRVNMGKTIVDRPQIYLKVLTETDRPPATTPSPAPARKDVPFILPVHKIDLEVLGGNAVVEMSGADARTQRVTFKNIASTVVLNEPGQTSRMNVSLDVDDGQAAGSVRAEGQATPPRKGWTLEDTDGTFTVSISQLNLESLAPLLALAGIDPQTGGILNADADVQIRKGVIESVTAEAVIEGFSQGVGEQKIVFDQPVTLIAKGGMIDQAIRIDEVNLQTPFCTVTASGDAEALDYAVIANLADTQSFIAQFVDVGDYGVAGALDLSGRLEMNEQAIAATGRGSIEDMRASKEGDEAPPTDVELDFDLTVDRQEQVLTIASAMLQVLPGTIRLRDVAVPMGQPDPSPITMTALAELDMAQAWPYAQVLADAPRDIQLAGLLDAEIELQKHNETVHLKTDKTHIRDLRVAKEDQEPFVQDAVNLTADITLNMERQSIGIQAFHMVSEDDETLIKIIKGTVEQSAENGMKRMDAEFEAEYDLEAVSALAAPYLPDGLRVRGRRTDRLVLSSEWPEEAPEQMRANLNGQAGFGFDSAEYVGLNVGPTTLMMEIAQGVVNVSIPETVVNQGILRFAGTIDLSEEPMFLRLSDPNVLLQDIHVDDLITQQLLTYVNPIFAGAVRTSGLATLTCRRFELPLSAEPLDKMNIDATLDIDDMRMQPGFLFDEIMPIVTLVNQLAGTGFNLQLQDRRLPVDLKPTDLQVVDGRVRYEDMTIEMGNFPLRFSGSLGLDNTLAMDVRIPIGRDIEADYFQVPLGGTVTSPTLDAARLPELIRQRLLREGLRRLF